MKIRGVIELSRAYLLQFVRSRTAIVWTVLFPQIWLFLFALIFRNFEGGLSGRMPGLLTITAFANSFFSASYSLVHEREQGILRRLWVTPATASTIVVANSFRALITVTASLVVQALVAWLVLDVDFGPSLLSVLVLVTLGIWAFVPMGLIMGCIARDMRTAPAIGNLIFFPMVFMSGAAIPLSVLPGWLVPIGKLMPTYHLTEALTGVMVRGEPLLQQGLASGVLFVSGVAAFGFNSLLFRWESTQPIGAKRVAAALVGLGVLYLVAALIS